MARSRGAVDHGVTDSFVVWFTGLPSAGKSTLAGMLAPELRARGLAVAVLDGDEIRAHLSRGLGFSKEDRDENIRRIAFVARLLSQHGVVAITATVSPYRAVRDEARCMIGRFVEVYVDCPLEVCMRRDAKGLYRKAVAGEIAQFTGVSDPYEPPTAAEVVVRTDRETPEESVGNLVRWLEAGAYIRPQRGHELVGVPSYLVAEIRRRAGASSEAVSQYVTQVLSEALDATARTDDLAPAERERILSRLRELGYLG
jgi:adenylyl-sulfate kinase